jgi:predicted metal-dependent phosphotriesterase family hydrolase
MPRVVEDLRARGVSDDDIDQMMRRTPRRILGAARSDVAAQ